MTDIYKAADDILKICDDLVQNLVEVPKDVIDKLDSLRTELAQVQEPVQFVPVDSRLRDENWNHPNDTEPCDQACQSALDARGDDKGQGLDGYWKWGFKAGWNAAKLASQPVQEPAPGYKPTRDEIIAVAREADLGCPQLNGVDWAVPLGTERFATLLLAAAPQAPERLPLTDEQLDSAQWDDDTSSSADFKAGARYAERAHGITTKNQEGNL